ncbi:MAG: BlaI/MecI/CopY family transcriptional regulator [Candidatus Marinimicrobia bacterium]|jgi:BlaI family penicillinase repressor|nr:BlaI/MecI/CopY family transcriptional regulator [Candidatus Neomarinimicrobiota bacterium]MCK9484274.1 BlaI/MecI/CopY family transcriptional regulator [Candidatus Neomarinimicrobiota bacterium]MDD5062161.1 BlaI/MecI/CopY family transcriptional regulator [Candidatus Neomarinimicrobiota bacterium]
MAKKENSLSTFEWQIMEILWKRGKATVRDVFDSLNGIEWAYTTVQTYMERMVTKKILGKEKIGPVNLYFPQITKDQSLITETRHFLNKSFDGSLPKLAAFLINSDDISEQDLEKIKALIEEKEKT